LEIDLPEGEEFETVAGFVFNRAGRLVEAGEEITFDGTRIVVEEVENTRIKKARLEQLDVPEEAEVESEEDDVAVADEENGASVDN